MNKNNYVISILILVSFMYSINHENVIDTSMLKGVVINQSDINFIIESDFDIYGIQLVIHYDNKELNLNEDVIISNMYGINIYSQDLNDSMLNVIIFGDNGQKIHDATNQKITDLFTINPKPTNHFTGLTTVKLSDITLAGHGGLEILYDADTLVEHQYELLFPHLLLNKLNQNFPEPFSDSTLIKYELSDEGMVALLIYDLNGSLVKTLINDFHEPGIYTTSWNGITDDGNPAIDGRFILKMLSLGFSDTITMTLYRK